MPSISRRAQLIAAVTWAILFVVAIGFDRPVADLVHDRGIAMTLHRHPGLLAIWKEPGNFSFTLAVIVIGLGVRRLDVRRACFIGLAVGLSGLNILPKWIVGRTRPFKLGRETIARPFDLEPFRHGLNGFLHQQNLSFPSGHACTSFALAIAVLVVAPRWGMLFFFFAAAVGIERVLENAHYCSDVIGGVFLAWAGVELAQRMLFSPQQGQVAKPERL